MALSPTSSRGGLDLTHGGRIDLAVGESVVVDDAVLARSYLVVGRTDSALSGGAGGSATLTGSYATGLPGISCVEADDIFVTVYNGKKIDFEDHLSASVMQIRDDGQVLLLKIPAADPHIVGALYTTAGAVRVSTG